MGISTRVAASAAILAWAALAGSTPVQAAGAPGWYVGAGGFATFPQNTNVTTDGVTGSPDIPGDPGFNCLLPINLLGNVQLLNFCLLGPGQDPTTGTPSADTIPAQRFRFSVKPGVGGGGTFGYAFESGFRPELSFDYSTADLDEVSVLSIGGQPVASNKQKAGGDLQTIRLMASAWYDLDLGYVFPYLGGGVGIQRTKTDLPGVLNDTDNNLGFQLGGGIGVLITKDLTLSVDYRYIATDDPKYRSDFDTSAKSEYESHNVGASLRYSFGTFGGTDTDGDGVPDRLDKCPGTPAGVAVYADGCPVDTDGDGVPDYRDKCPGTPPGSPVNSDGCPVDSDGDGVPDHADQCPGTPPGMAVDARGCPLDSDGDGVPDNLDRCPGTVPGTPVDASGCSLLDSDGDGVPDSLDKCPNSARGQRVGPDGCPLDSDGDGIPDDLDACPNTPKGLKVLPDGCALVGDCRKPRPGEKVDARGCALDKRFILRGVKFEFDSDRLTAEAEVILNEVSATLAAYPQVKLDVEGHTDSLGTDAYNLGLSERRAISVIKYLDGRGVDTTRMKAVGFGESVPIDDNNTDAGRENNRRVEFKVTGGE